MRRFVNHTLLWGVLGLLTGCGEILGEAGNISGTVSAPAGGDVLGTDVFACFANQEGCEQVGITIEQAGAAANYTLSGLPRGSYGVYAFKDVDGDGVPENGDAYGYYSTDDRATLVTPPAIDINIRMYTLTGATTALPEVLNELISNP